MVRKYWSKERKGISNQEHRGAPGTASSSVYLEQASCQGVDGMRLEVGEKPKDIQGM